MDHLQRLEWCVVVFVSRMIYPLYNILLAPLTVTLVCLLLVNQHPSPVDDCPCFEDAIAFVSVILGMITSFWCSKRVPALNADLFTSKTPGATFDSSIAIMTWMLFALLKLTTGILVILAWRMLAKPIVQTLLPPLFRWLAHASPVRLPHRRHYTPATEYSHGPPHRLRAVPSMIDLDLAMAQVVDEGNGGIASGREGRTAGQGAGAGTFKRRGLPSEDAQEKAVVFEVREGGALENDDKVKHYDADGTCASWHVFGHFLDICTNILSYLRHVSFDEGGRIRWNWGLCPCNRACDVRGARMGCLKPPSSRIFTWSVL